MNTLGENWNYIKFRMIHFSSFTGNAVGVHDKNKVKHSQQGTIRHISFIEYQH